jgi:hypothetical protein
MYLVPFRKTPQNDYVPLSDGVYALCLYIDKTIGFNVIEFGLNFLNISDLFSFHFKQNFLTE